MESGAEKTDTTHIKSTHGQKQCLQRVLDGRVLGGLSSELCSEAGVWWACPLGVRFSGWSQQSQEPSEGWQGLPSTWRGWPTSYPRRWQSLAWECQVGGDTARFLPELGRRAALEQLYSCQTRALWSPASSGSSERACAGLRLAQSVQKGLVTATNSFHYSTLTSLCRQALRTHINPSLDHNLNSLAKVLPNQMQKIPGMSSNSAYKIE